MEKIVVTGGAGFIGSNLSEALLEKGFSVTVVDNLSTGREQNLSGWSEKAGDRFTFIRMSINDTAGLRSAFKDAAYVFHLAAIPSVPRSISDPESTQLAGINGTLSVLLAARDVGVRRVVAASSSSIYGDDPNLPKKEERIGHCLSPYALSKFVTEEYCRLFYELYGLETVALRYFNVFGPRQDPNSDYAAVIPKFATLLLDGKQPTVYGDGEQTRDFTFISNVVDANWRAATQPNVAGQAFNIGCGTRTSLNELLAKLGEVLGIRVNAKYEETRKGDVRDSHADISKARTMLGYSPSTSLEEGLRRVVEWYRDRR
jgi:UDP-glucose 4-epimerase